MARIRVLAENPPPPRGYVEDQLRELRDYITRMKDELEFLLTHLGTDNMDRSLSEEIDSLPESFAALTDRLDALDAKKQDTLTFDEAPTQGSRNPVTSRGIFNNAAQYSTGINMAGGDIRITRRTATASGANFVAVWARGQSGAKYTFGVWYANFFAVTGGSGATVSSVGTQNLVLTIPSDWASIAVQCTGVPISSIGVVT